MGQEQRPGGPGTLYAGDVEAGETAPRPLRAHGKPRADVVGPMPYTAFQKAFDPLLSMQAAR